MNVITIESEAFEQIITKLNQVVEEVKKRQDEQPLSERWLDNYDVCRLLHISKRTLQHYRDSGTIPFTQHGNKIYYKATDIEKFLEDNYRPIQK